jgi:cell division protein FtsL
MVKWLKKIKKNQFYVAPKEYRMVLIAVSGLMIVAMIFVWCNIRLVGLAYQYQILEKTHRDLLRENHLLRVERESLQSLDRIQKLAKSKVGLREPESSQIITIFLKE